MCARDLNGWVGDRLRLGITGGFGVLGENNNGRRVIDFCAVRGLCFGNTHIEHRSLKKYTSLARGHDGMEVMSMIDLVLVKS